MKESTAWRLLAEDHDAGLGSSYLCNTLKYGDAYPTRVSKAPLDLRVQMIGRIDAALDFPGNAAYDGEDLTYAEEREARVLACLLFAEQARDEEKAQ